MMNKDKVRVKKKKDKIMLQRDYIQRLIREFMAALERMLEKKEVEKRLSKMDMLAELYYHEADMVGQPARDELLNKAFMLFDYVEAHGDTFSIERRNKMAEIKQKIGDALN